jgi:hypothetical protein
MEIGRVVGSRDQTDYVIHVHAVGDVASPPSPNDRGFGQFVAVPIGDDFLVGVVYTTQLVNPSYGTLGPRLSTESELPIFSPDYLPETATLVGVVAVGTIRGEGASSIYDQTTPRLASAIDAPARTLSDAEFLAFHYPDGRLRLAYFPRLLARPFPSLADLLCAIIDRLAAERPVEAPRLQVARQNLRWRAVFGTT